MSEDFTTPTATEQEATTSSPAKLNFGETLKDAIAIGTKNVVSVILAVFLWLATIWIPYLNVGTTIAISLIPTELAKGNVINPLFIFQSKYRRYMGEYILTYALIAMGIGIGMLFCFIPAIVIGLSWSLSIYFLIERGLNPMQAIQASSNAMYGNKLIAFGLNFVLGIILFIINFIILSITGAIDVAFITFILVFAMIGFNVAVALALQASIWRQLKDNVA